MLPPVALAVLVVTQAPAPAPAEPPPSTPSFAPRATTAAPSAQVAYVQSTMAPVRAQADEKSALVVEAGIGTALRVDERLPGGPWVRVVVAPRVFHYESLEADPVALAPRTFDVRWPTGFVHVDDIGPGPPSRAQLVKDAAAAAAAGDDARRRLLLLRAWSLDPHDDDVAGVGVPVAPAAQRRVSSRVHAPFERAALVFGCSGDVARAVVVAGSLGALGGPRPPPQAGADTCVAHVDTRAPCGAPRSLGGGAAPSLQEHKEAMARLRPRYGADGPALRLDAVPGASERPLFVVARLLVGDGCVDCIPTVTTADTKVTRLRVPRIESGRTVLHVLVPRYAGVVYDVVSGGRDDIDDSPQQFELGDSFDADPRDDPGPGEHLFAAPEACCVCDADDDGDDGAP